MSDSYYGQGLYYGDGNFYGAAETGDVPRDVQWYRTNVEGKYVFHWEFDPIFISPLLATVDWELELDTMPTFNSPNFVSYNKTSADDFQDGNTAKGYQVIVASRIDKITQQWYSRVRTVNGSVSSGYSNIIPFTIPELFIEETAENLIRNLPDNHVYDKDVLNEDPADRDTNLYSLTYRGLGTEFDKIQLEKILTIGDVYIRSARDEALYDNFGHFFRFIKPQSTTNVEYRRCVQDMMIGSLSGGTIDAIQEIAQCHTGVPATIFNVRDTLNFIIFINEFDLDVSYLDDISSDQPVLNDTSAAGFGIIIFLNNPGLFTLDVDLITFLIKQILPAHINVQVLS